MHEKYTPLVNGIIEELLAQAPDKEDGIAFLKAMVFAGVDRLAREAGRMVALDLVEGVEAYVKTAQPERPWLA